MTEISNEKNESMTLDEEEKVQVKEKNEENNTIIDEKMIEKLQNSNLNSISMSAGADPWADPPIFVTESSEMKKPERENPWANTNSDEMENPINDEKINENFTIEQSNEEENYTLLEDPRKEEFNLPKFGKSALKYFNFKPGFLNFNNGAYGSCPKVVLDSFKYWSDKQEECPDYFRYNIMSKELEENRKRLSKILNCDFKDLSLISNTSIGTNAVLRDLIFSNGDGILTLQFTYDSVDKLIDYLIESEEMRGIKISNLKINLNLPKSDKEEIIRIFENSILDFKKKGFKIKIAILDTISSKPAIKLPLKELIEITKKYEILSFVDGAHGIGCIPIDLTNLNPDFFISNCHKWLFCHRSCAIFYCSKKVKHIQRSSLPTSWYFKKQKDLIQENDNENWLKQWTFNSTLDLSPILTIQSALEFREKLGGEARILNYNYNLAIKGGKILSKILQTEIFQNFNSTSSMTNVRLPILKSKILNFESKLELITKWFFEKLHNEFKCAISIFNLNLNFYARFSSQIWLEEDDFVFAARALLDLCNRINKGNVLEEEINNISV